MLKIFKSASQTRNERFAADALARQLAFTREELPTGAPDELVSVVADVHAYARFGGRKLDLDGASLINCRVFGSTAVGHWTEERGCHVLTVTGTREDVRLWLKIWDR